MTSRHEKQVRAMMQSGKISATEGERLLLALETHGSTWRLLINPFDRLSTAATWITALAASAAGIGIARMGTRFNGALDLHYSVGALSWPVVILDAVNAILVTAAVFWLASLLVAKQGRITDFITSVAIARMPLVAAGFFLYWVALRPEEMLRIVQTNPADPRILLNAAVTLLMMVWFIVLLYGGFKTSSGLKGARLGFTFTGGLILAEIVTKAILIVLVPALLPTGILISPASATPTVALGEIDRLEGRWEGALNPRGAVLRIVLRVTPTADGAYTAVVDSPDQGAAGLPVSIIEIDGDAVRFEMSIGARFEGTLNETQSQISGTWSQGGGTLSLVLTRTPAGATGPEQIFKPISKDAPERIVANSIRESWQRSWSFDGEFH